MASEESTSYMYSGEGRRVMTEFVDDRRRVRQAGKNADTVAASLDDDYEDGFEDEGYKDSGRVFGSAGLKLRMIGRRVASNSRKQRESGGLSR